MPNAGLYRALPQSATGDDAWDTHQHWEPPYSTNEQPAVPRPTSEVFACAELDHDDDVQPVKLPSPAGYTSMPYEIELHDEINYSEIGIIAGNQIIHSDAIQPT